MGPLIEVTLLEPSAAFWVKETDPAVIPEIDPTVPIVRLLLYVMLNVPEPILAAKIGKLLDELVML